MDEPTSASTADSMPFTASFALTRFASVSVGKVPSCANVMSRLYCGQCDTRWMPVFEITSVRNERIKRLRRLRDRRQRDEEGVFVVEGPRLFSRALETGHEPLEVYTDGSVENPGDAPEILVDRSVLDAASYRKTSEGLIAVFSQWSAKLEDLRLSEPSLLIVADGLEKPGNLGAIMRTAAASGTDGLVTIGGSSDPYNPNAIRASTGAVFSLPVVRSDFESLRSWLNAKTLPLIALAPEATQTIWETDLARSCALMVGSEDAGVSRQALRLADETATIPMRRRGVDSLNTSVALAVTAYEAVRQRGSLLSQPEDL